ALTLEQSIGVRIREASASYTAFLLNRIQEAQTDERRRIARELHDRIGHGMSVTHRQLELYTLYRDTEPAKASIKVETAQEAILESMRNLRAVASDLYVQEPVSSLEKALLNYLQTAGTPEQTTVRVLVNGDERWAPPDIIDEAFLIAREA